MACELVAARGMDAVSAAKSCEQIQQSLVVRRKPWTTTNTTSTRSPSRPTKNKTNDLTKGTDV